MKKLEAQVIFATFIMMLATAVATVIVLVVLFALNALPQVENPALIWPIVALGVCVLVGSGLSAVLTRWYFKPVKQLIRATRHIAMGDFSVRVEESGARNELVELMKSFNVMAEELGSIELFRRDFINSFSHEFRTPIVSIRGFAKQLQNNNLTDQQRSEYTGIIINEAERLTNMASNILTLTKVENQQIMTDRSTFRLDEQIRSCILLLQKEWENKNITFDIELEEISYNSNEEMLAHIWLNLISNAIKFSHQNGEVRLYCGIMDKAVRVEIEDNGIGMDSETKQHIFEQFYRGQMGRSTAGNGLGLTIVKSIVNLAHGEISVESEVNRGALFIVILPIE